MSSIVTDVPFLTPKDLNACLNCKIANLPCYERSRPCVNCVSFGKLSTCVDQVHVIGLPKRNKGVKKRGFRSNVLSACINCKAAHAACDVSRPCKRCVSQNKANTCKDISQKKRGRPKGQGQKLYTNNEYSNQIIYDNTISDQHIVNQTMPPIYESVQRNPQLNEDMTLEGVHTSEQALSDMPLLYSGFQQKQPKVMIDRLELFNTDLINEPNFVPTLQQQQENNELISMILSMEICCVTVSKEVYSLWGYYPQDIAHHSLYEFILPSDADRLLKLHRQHLEHIMEISSSSGTLITEKSTSSMFNTADEATLIQIARGSKIYSDMINIKTNLGGYELYEVVTYIGGGLGADLFDQTTLSKQYIVANFRRCQYNQEQIKTIEESVQTVLDYMNPIAVFSPVSYPVTPPAIDQVSDDLPMANVTHIEDDWLTHTTSTNLQESKFKQGQPSPPSSFRAPKFNTAPGTNCPINSNKFSPLFNRVTLSSKVMHPAQYFLQTSNSTLSSAASAAKSESRYSLFGSSVRHTHGISSRTRIEMSISSLLC